MSERQLLNAFRRPMPTWTNYIALTIVLLDLAILIQAVRMAIAIGADDIAGGRPKLIAFLSAMSSICFGICYNGRTLSSHFVIVAGIAVVCQIVVIMFASATNGVATIAVDICVFVGLKLAICIGLAIVCIVGESTDDADAPLTVNDRPPSYGSSNNI